MNAKRLAILLCLATMSHGCSKSSAPSSKPAAVQPEMGKAETPPPGVPDLTPQQETRVRTALAKLSDTDRALAETQKYCPIHKGRLGSMGKPERIELEGQPVFLCCSACTEQARAEPKATLEQVAAFKKGAR